MGKGKLTVRDLGREDSRCFAGQMRGGTPTPPEKKKRQKLRSSVSETARASEPNVVVPIRRVDPIAVGSASVDLAVDP